MKYEIRPFVFVKIPLPQVHSIIRPEQVIVEFARSKSVDFGALCYLRRSSQPRRGRQGRLVDLSSLDDARVGQIRKMIECASGFFTSSGRRPASLLTMYYVWNVFMDWCDSQGHTNVLRDIESARAAVHAWIMDRRRLVDQHQMQNNTAAGYQDQIIKVLEDYYATSELALGINLMRENQDLKISTPIPDDRDQERVLAWATCLMTHFCRLLLGEPGSNKPEHYPFLLSIPECAGHPSGKLWIFPLGQWCINSKTKTRGFGYDYQSGKLLTAGELKAARPHLTDAKVSSAVRSANAVIAAANADPFHWTRMEKGSQAQAAFYVLFLSLTGANEAQASALPWSEELEQRVLEPSTSRQGFREIKYRAAGREVSFEIGVQFMPLLRRFLELRRYMLAGYHSDFLFFQYNNRKNGDRNMIDRAHRMLDQFYSCLGKIIPNEFNTVKSKQWRASKQHRVARRGDPALAAIVMQHSVTTALRNYSNGSEVEHQEEMGRFFSEVQKTVLAREIKIHGGEARPVGLCTMPNKPVSIVSEPPIPVECSRPDGCLYCENYRMHADEIDVRKVISARYCIRMTAQYATSVEENDQVFGQVLERIDYVLNEVRTLDSELVARVEMEVDIEGLLDSFWSAKLDTLMALGMELL